MALTAALRSLMIGLISALLTMIAQKTGLTDLFDIPATAEAIGSALTVAVTGLVAYWANKLGNKYPWVNWVLSFGRARTGAMFIPAGEESILVVSTPTGEPTAVTSSELSGRHLAVAV